MDLWDGVWDWDGDWTRGVWFGGIGTGSFGKKRS